MSVLNIEGKPLAPEARRMLDYPTGHNGPLLLSAVELQTGKIAWRNRGFAKAQLL
jgi:hypothetical protein